jgi:heat-inducible transcriptional repressor
MFHVKHIANTVSRETVRGGVRWKGGGGIFGPMERAGTPDLGARAAAVLRFIVGAYLRGGAPVGSRTVSRGAGLDLSPASIRNVMADLEDAGLLRAPHVSAGRVPTEAGLRLYIDALMEAGELPAAERAALEAALAQRPGGAQEVVARAGALLSDLSACAALVVAPRAAGPVRQIQFVALSPGRVLAVVVRAGGAVENRLLDVPPDLPPGALEAAGNYLSERLSGQTLEAARAAVEAEVADGRARLDAAVARLVRAGLEVIPGAGDGAGPQLVVRGQARLLEDVQAAADLERARALLAYLEERQATARLLSLVEGAQGVQIFIGAENRAFDQSGWSLVLSPYRVPGRDLVGAIGVIGPVRLNYDRIIPMVDYTSRIVGHLVEEMGA